MLVRSGSNLTSGVNGPKKTAENQIPHPVAQKFEAMAGGFQIFEAAIAVIVAAKEKPQGLCLGHQYLISRSSPLARAVVVEAVATVDIDDLRLLKGHNILRQ